MCDFTASPHLAVLYSSFTHTVVSTPSTYCAKLIASVTVRAGSSHIIALVNFDCTVAVAKSEITA